MEVAAIVLAAGAGTRMKSKKPKVVHEMLGKPLITWALDAACDAGATKIVTVVGHQKEQVIPLIEDRSAIVEQTELLGTGDAVLRCREALADFDGPVLVTYGDCPLISPETLATLINVQEESSAGCVVLAMKLDDPFGYGRIIRDEESAFAYIVEHKDASDEEALVKECNSGFYCFDARTLFDLLPLIGNDNAGGEYYLTDVLELCVQQGKGVEVVVAQHAEECLGINSRGQLAEATAYAQRRINAQHMANGVTMMAPDLVWIEPSVKIDPDVELLPGTMLMGKTVIGEDSVIGPNTRLTDTKVGKACRIDETVAIDVTMDDKVTCGPRAYLRPGTHLCEGAKAGTHVEIKKSYIGKGSKVPHLSYIGDALVGDRVNIGAGTITCNYDGVNKSRTVIGDDAFIGSDTMLVAPVAVGERTVIGAGSTITKDVPDGALGIARAKQEAKEGWYEARVLPAKKKKEEERAKGTH